MLKGRQSHYLHLDLILMLVFFILVSSLAIYNAQQLEQYPDNFVVKQLIYYAIGIGVAISIQFVDLDQMYRTSFYLYLLGVVSLIILHFSPEAIARPVNGAKSWFNNKVPFISIQPSEFAKIFFVLYLAYLIYRHQKKYRQQTLRSDLILIGKMLLATVVPAFLIWKQPDLGTTLVFLFITAVLIVLSGVDWKIIAVMFTSGVVAVVGAVLLIVNFPDFSENVLRIEPHQIKRVTTWFDPSMQDSNDRYHIDLSLQTVGSGQITGKGMKSAQVQLPEAHTDFIFSIIGESFGFLGSTVVILVFFLFLYKLVTLGMKVASHNPFASYVCYGIMALILIHTFQNIGMTIGLMPITGIPLLFISYGGSTTLSTMIAYGIIYRIAVEQSKQEDFLFN
ncbi:MAG TPA: FtsW/RodA/SpoVE family cell cycle protein [Pseudogracilibacillus sp.]|nr:FtsW/RodA/SpoVE family cell cycle protein [Pseudogracilibacillus sp.]